MTHPFRSFVIFAEMRTGSNLLEATLNAIKYVTCFGEAFNPYMMGWPDKEVRELCTFSAHSLTRDPPFSRIDLVSCRNLLIYLDAELQEKVIPLFHFALRPGGFLFLGNSENASRHQNLFVPVEPRSRIFRRLDTATRVFADFPFTSVDRPQIARSAGHGASMIQPTAARDLTRWAEHAMERHNPAFVVIDEGHNVLHFSGPMGRFLAPASGAASLNLLQLVHPALRAELRNALSRAAVEELLRFEPPVGEISRVAVSDLEIAGQHVAAGELVAMSVLAANRDPAAYAQPDIVDFDRFTTRESPSILSFGRGIHHCLGSALARQVDQCADGLVDLGFDQPPHLQHARSHEVELGVETFR